VAVIVRQLPVIRTIDCGGKEKDPIEQEITQIVMQSHPQK
jgi:hypothetical protein